MTATRERNCTTPTVPVLRLALELESENWKVVLTTDTGQKPQLRTIASRHTDALLAEIKSAKKGFGP
jgi:hypothetical protein